MTISFDTRARLRFTAALMLFSIAAPAAARGAAVRALDATPAASRAVLVDMRATAAEIFSWQPPRAVRLATHFGVPASVWEARKEAARERGASFQATPVDREGRPLPILALHVDAEFGGMSDSTSICPYFGGCQPPDAAIAASSKWVMQGVNTSFAVYDAAGALQTGWPKTAQAFFGVSNPGSCDPLGPFMSNPRALYDPVDRRFWVAALQTEGAFGLNQCSEKSLLWVAVSKTADPRGAWFVYVFGLRSLTSNAGDFPAIGLDGQAFYYSANMFDQEGLAFQYAELYAASKTTMEAGAPVTANGMRSITFNGALVDTVQPVAVEGTSPAAGLFVASQNITEGGGNCASGCSSVRVFALANPLGTQSLSAAAAAVLPYSLAPQADEPNCFACIETLDTRISATPVYAGGLISFGLETAVSNGTSVVPGVLWGQLAPVLNGQVLKRVSVKQESILSLSGDQAASFPALMPDAAGNLLMVFDTMSSTINPGIEYAGRLSTDPLGQLSAPSFLQRGRRTIDALWGEYSAASFEGPTTNKIWIASEYGASNGDWTTAIGATNF